MLWSLDRAIIQIKKTKKQIQTRQANMHACMYLLTLTYTHMHFFSIVKNKMLNHLIPYKINVSMMYVW